MDQKPIQLDYARPVPVLRRPWVLVLLGLVGLATAGAVAWWLFRPTRVVIATVAPPLTPLRLDLPRPLHESWVHNSAPYPNLERGYPPRPPVMVPPGTALLSRGKRVTGSDPEPVIGSYDLVTDGIKDAEDGNWVELAPGMEWVQVDLEKACTIYAVAVWHRWADHRPVRDVVVRVSDDPAFAQGVATIFNNDHDNSAQLGAGTDKEYYEFHDGKVIDARGVKGRYVRVYGNGAAGDELYSSNAYTEVEVHGAR